MNGHQHYVAGEEFLRRAERERLAQSPDSTEAAASAAIASAHFLAAAAAQALSGRYGDPARDMETAGHIAVRHATPPVRPATPPVDLFEKERWG